jgi:hypothetical protein
VARGEYCYFGVVVISKSVSVNEASSPAPTRPTCRIKFESEVKILFKFLTTLSQIEELFLSKHFSLVL